MRSGVHVVFLLLLLLCVPCLSSLCVCLSRIVPMHRWSGQFRVWGVTSALTSVLP